jgi:putative methyltransferase (TIGR04325 family)
MLRNLRAMFMPVSKKPRVAGEPLRKQYENFDAALADSGAGYDDVDLANAVLQKTMLARQRPDWPHLSWLQGAALFFVLPYAALKLGTRPLRILDFGGAFGVHAMIAMSRFPNIAMKWAVVESEAFSAIAAPVEGEALRVFSSIEAAHEWLGGIDIVHSASALQYMPNPDCVLARLVGLNAPLMLWQRMMFSNGLRTIVVSTTRLWQNGMGPLPPGFEDREVKYPEVFVTEAEFLAGHRDYRVTVQIPGTELHADGLARFGDVLLLERDVASPPRSN